MALLGAITLTLVGAIGYTKLTQMSAAVQKAAKNSTQRAQMNVDMMHDALRADVFLALHESLKRNPAIQEVKADFAEHTENMRLFCRS